MTELKPGDRLKHHSGEYTVTILEGDVYESMGRTVYPAQWNENGCLIDNQNFLWPDAGFTLIESEPTAALKDKTGKLNIAELPISALNEMQRGFEDGKKKYARFDYFKGHSKTDLLSAIIRHAYKAMWEGPLAEDSGVSHLGHIMANAAILVEQERRGACVDDTPAAKK